VRKQTKFGKPGEEVLSRLKSGTPALATVSGILTTNPETIRMIDTRIPEIAVITTKSYQLDENAGYREPIVAEPEQGCFVNAVGLRNPGMEQGHAALRTLRE
jgi:dihydroorotate dehydrogenase